MFVFYSISVAVIFFENRLPVGNEMHDSVSSPACEFFNIFLCIGIGFIVSVIKLISILK